MNVRFAGLFILGVVVAFAPSGCVTQPNQPPSGASPEATTAPTPLPEVNAPQKAARPSWIASVSPTGKAADGAQIRVRFQHDVVPVEALEAPDRADVLSHFQIEPALPGRFIILTPRMIAFQADRQVPHASRIVVTLTAGLADMSGNKLGADYAWSFTTEPLTLSSLPGTDPNATLEPQELRPQFGITASDALDTGSLVARAHLVSVKDSNDTATVELAPTPTPDPSAPPATASDTSGADTSNTEVQYQLQASRDLSPGTTYALVVESGVASAYGNMPTAATYKGKLAVRGPLTFQGAAMASGETSRFRAGLPQLAFSNPLDATSIAHTVALEPSPNPSLPLTRVDGNVISLDPDALKPSTTYLISAGAAIKDVFGQTLGSNASARLNTGDLAPDIWAPSGLTIYPAGLKLGLDVYATNLPKAAYRSAFRVLTPADLVAHDPSLSDDILKLLPSPDAWTSSPIAQLHDVETKKSLPLNSLLGGTHGLLAYGITANTVPTTTNGKPDWVQPQYDGAVGLTNLGVFAQWFPESGVVRVNHLSDGTPVAGAAIDVYASYTDSDSKDSAPAQPRPCAQGTTGSDGMWHVAAGDFATCASTARSSDQAPGLLTIARVGDDWAFARTSTYDDGYRFGLDNGGWSAGTPVSHGTIFSDRTLYQPGEDAKFVGIAYFDIDGALVHGRSSSYAITATTPSGAKVNLGTASLDAFGALPIAYHFGPHAEVGSWSIAATGTNGEEIDGSFTVAEFKPPNFKVDLTLDHATASAGTSVEANAKSAYLFGAPVDGGTTTYTVTRERAYFQPPGWDAYVFGPQWFYPEEPPSPTTDVLQKDVKLAADGTAPQSVAVANDLPFPMTYTVSAQTTDVSNLAVADTKTFTALPGDAIIGLSTPFVAVAGTNSAVQAIVVDAAGKFVSGRDVKVTLEQRIADTATQVVEGGETPHQTVHYVEVDSKTFTSTEGPQALSFAPPKNGDYRIVANFTSGGTDATATDAELWVTGAGEAAWFTPENNALPVKLDKPTYRPGDVATALVQSPFADAELYFAVVRHGVIYATTQIVHGSAPKITFKVTPAMLPDAAVEAVVVRRGPALANGVPAKLDKLSQAGFASFEVAFDSKYLKVDVKPQHATLAPAGSQALSLHLTDKSGKPVRGEVVVGVVNDAILQLTGYRFPDLAKIVYADMPISTRFADSRGDVQLVAQHRFYEKGQGFGGGAMAGPAGTRVRTKFMPLAYWNPAVRTDATGTARVTFTLPDDLTTWHVMAVAITPDARFGNGDATFITTKPLVTNPIVPQFARPGDRFAAGASLTTITAGAGSAQVSASIAGGITFAASDPHTANASADITAQTQAQRFDLIVSGDSDAQLTVKTALMGSDGKTPTASDAFAFPIPVIVDNALESAIQTGTTSASASVPLNVAPELVQANASLGGLDVTVASTLLAESMEPARDLTYQPGPFLDERASRLAIAADATILDRTFGSTTALPRLAKSASADITALQGLALSDGGFGYWPGDKKSELYTTAFTVQQLLQAKAAGFNVSSLLTPALGYLGKALANPVDVGACSSNEGDGGLCVASARLEALETLGAAGDVRTDFLSDIDAVQEKMSYYERVEFAHFLTLVPEWKQRGLALRDKLFEQVSLTGRHGAVDLRAGGESEVAGQSQMLGLAIASGTAGDDVDRLLRTLLDLRHNGRWGCVCDDAEAMNALVAYAARNATPPNFVASLSLPSQPAQTLHDTFKGYAKTTAAHHLALGKLQTGASKVSFGMNGTGTLHYVVSLSYPVPPTSPGTYQGIRIDRILHAPAGGSPLVTLSLAKPDGPTTVDGSRVYDVEDRIITDHPLNNLVITDPLPAGFEAVDQSFRTAAPTEADRGDTFDLDYQAIYRDRVLSFVQHLEPGSYAFHYLVRAVTPGTFGWPGATAAIADAPEEFGRTAATQLVVK